ncbi:hypothetical protein BS50DRAFT_575245 [Corynespora cassiicola Philippines]|uniref:Rhodopsin domain-containing protein n=1 Tax=Corynespora cassiicola Philippines TaxID=1448308 RepID=A0A2T2NIF4_CORCC|nr:hypothetical protein BS50DRAFT_575245 [Corynespora cassiicola Philippines]
MAVVPGTGPPDPKLIPDIPSDLSMRYAHAFAGLAVALSIIGTLVFGGRMYTRFFPVYRMQADDWVCMVAYALVIVDTGLLLNTIPYAFHGNRRSTWNLADTQNSFYYAFLAQPLWSWAMAMIKTSIALMLLRLEQKQLWRKFLWTLIVVQILLALYNMLTQVMQCFPLKGAWDLLGVVEAKCWSKNAIRVSSICVSTVNVVTDFILSIMPISFLSKIQRPLRERAIIGCLMALGIFAGVASIVKMVAAAQFGRTNDPNSESIQIGMWSSIEELVGLIAACIPCLRSPFQRFLEYFGLVSTHPRSTYDRGYGKVYEESGKMKGTKGRLSVNGHGGGIKMKGLHSADAHSEENILQSPADDAKDGKIWRTTEVHLEEDLGQLGRVLSPGQPVASWSEESHLSKTLDAGRQHP